MITTPNAREEQASPADAVAVARQASAAAEAALAAGEHLTRAERGPLNRAAFRALRNLYVAERRERRARERDALLARCDQTLRDGHPGREPTDRELAKYAGVGVAVVQEWRARMALSPGIPTPAGSYP